MLHQYWQNVKSPNFEAISHANDQYSSTIANISQYITIMMEHCVVNRVVEFDIK